MPSGGPGGGPPGSDGMTPPDGTTPPGSDGMTPRATARHRRQTTPPGDGTTSGG